MTRACEVLDCDRPVRSRNLCSIHYDRWIKSGRKEVGPSGRLHFPASGECSVDDCDRPVRCKGLCARHYDQGRRSSVCPACNGRKLETSALCASCHDALTAKVPTERACSGCGETKPVEAFGWRKDGSGRSKVRSRCRACESAAAREAYAKNADTREKRKQAAKLYSQRLRNDPERKFWLSIRSSARRLGLDMDAVMARVHEVGNRCEACGQEPPTGERVHLDHCHDSGKFRGLLCQPCNLMLGFAKNDSVLLRGVADYIDKARGLGPDCAAK